MHLGKDFFLIAKFVVAVIRLFGRVFGDQDDRKSDDEVENNHSHDAEVVIKSNSPNSSRTGKTSNH